MLDKEKIGKTIAQYRKELGMTQKELGNLLHISCQAVSKWESGSSLPTTEMLYEIANVLGVGTDAILRSDRWNQEPDVIYRQAGMDWARLQLLKNQLEEISSKNENLMNCHFSEPVLYKADVSGMQEPVHAMVNVIPGSKVKLARERGFDREICADVAANGMNHILTYGMKPVVLKGMVVCGNNNNEQLRNMAEALKEVCEENDVMFAGMEIGAQPMNHKADEYELSVCLAGVGDQSRLITGEKIGEGDVLLGIRTEGINTTNYPLIKTMMDENPELFYAKIDESHYFIDEILRPNVAFCREVLLLLEQDMLHGIFVNYKVMDQRMSRRIPQRHVVRIDLEKLPVLPLYRFMLEQKLVDQNMMPYYFQMGIGMTVVVPKEQAGKAMEIIRRYHDCYEIGSIEKYDTKNHPDGKLWVEGRLRW